LIAHWSSWGACLAAAAPHPPTHPWGVLWLRPSPPASSDPSPCRGGYTPGTLTPTGVSSTAPSPKHRASDPTFQPASPLAALQARPLPGCTALPPVRGCLLCALLAPGHVRSWRRALVIVQLSLGPMAAPGPGPRPLRRLDPCRHCRACSTCAPSALTLHWWRSGASTSAR
jgi:hypothetical protein